jgi:hypothetical protein
VLTSERESNMSRNKAMVTRILETMIENAVNHSKIVATEIIDDILKGAVKTDNNSTKRKHSVRQNFCHLERKISNDNRLNRYQINFNANKTKF